jgi:hypothetical protein
MDGWEKECRQAAVHCVEKAKATVDQATRVELLIIDQRWLDLAKKPMLQRSAGDPATS